jgi:RIO kinase 1
MKPHLENTFEDQFDEIGSVPRIRNAPSLKTRKINKHRLNNPASLPGSLQDLAAIDDDRQVFKFSYQASRYERPWLTGSLGSFFEAHWVDDVLRMIKGGKEATVYLCKANPTSTVDYLAAKVYRPRQFRNLKKDYLYREGRQDLDSNGEPVWDDRMLRAIDKKTGYGQELLHTSWIEYEFMALEVLHQAGADIPIPYTRGNNAILMEYIGDPEMPAPSLNEVDLSTSEARPLFQRVLHNIELMLANNRIHGDLSAYNILYWQGKITLIDFPQTMHPEQSPNSFQIFERDVRRVCEHFARQGVKSDSRKIASGLWTAYRHRLFPEVDPHFLDDQNESDRQYWEKRTKNQ